MFPEIVRDEVFRLETKRLWLRWPTMADAFDNAATGRPAPLMAGTDLRLPGVACIAAWRTANESGQALHLVLEDKQTRAAIGTVDLTLSSPGQAGLEYRLDQGRRGEGLMTEAVQAVVHMAYLLEAVPLIAVSPLASDRSGRGVLERCGFTYAGSGMRAVPGQGLVACDHFRLDRRTWSSLRGWGGPGFSGLPWRVPQPARIAITA